MSHRTWTTPREEHLRHWYGVKPTGELASELGVSEDAIYAKAIRMGITAAARGTSGGWLPDEIETLKATYPIIGNACAPLCGHSPRQTSGRARYEHLRRLTKREHKVPRNRVRGRVVVIVARWCVTHGVPTERTLEACAEAAGCTPQMMRLVLPALLEDERRRRKR